MAAAQCFNQYVLACNLRNSVLLKFNDKTQKVGDELRKPGQLQKEILPSWPGAIRIIQQ
jgi:hypothetical protein